MGRARHHLAPLLDPEGVAVIGASESPGKYGQILLRTLIEQGYRGAIHAVNPRGGSLLGLPFLRSLEEVQGALDVALVVRPAEECPAVVRELARRGVPFAIVYAAGFAETGREGEELQRALVEASRAGPTRLVGPNGMNVFSAPSKLNLSGIVPFPEGGLAFLSASGNLGYAFAQEAATRGRVGFSRFVSVGNQADLALDEYLDFLREDAPTRAVLLYLEGFVKGRAQAFLDVLARTAAEKPVLVLRGGRTPPGQRAARSHTAALSPGPLALRAALEQAGAVLLERADEALAVAEAFLGSPLPRGRRVVLVGEGGGHATLSSDTAAEAGLELPPLPDSLLDEIRPHLPAYAAIVRNPVEMGGISEIDPRVYERVLGPLFAWPDCDQIVLFGGYALYDARTAAFLDERRATSGKPVLLHDLYAEEDRPAFERLAERKVPVYASADVAVRAAAALVRGAHACSRAREAAALAGPASPFEPSSPPLPRELADLVEQGRSSRERALSEDGALRLLSHFDVPTLPSALAASAEEAVQAAERLGYPVVLKVHSAAVLHKTDSGGVRLDLRRPDEVREAYAAIFARHVGVAQGVRVTPFRSGGLEVLVGARRDPELGALLLVGAGGIMAEAMDAVALRRLPCSARERQGMLDESGVSRLLERARGGPAPDPEGVLGALDGLARLVATVPAVEEVEVNPLRCSARGCVALDARVIFAP